MTDPLFRMLGDLPHATPDPDRAARVRTRCHAVLTRDGRGRRGNRNGRVTETLLACLGAAYLIETVRQALHAVGVG